jgi:hypothetical protein
MAYTVMRGFPIGVATGNRDCDRGSRRDSVTEPTRRARNPGALKSLQ